MTLPSKINNHTEVAYERLLGQFKDKPIIQAILQTWTDKIQEVENDLYDLMTKTLFLNAEGSNLERYGQLFGIQFPEGLTDAEYLELLISEILTRSSDGTPDRIRQILEATTGIYGTRFFEHYNQNQKPFVMGCNVVYGYADDGVTFDVTSSTKEAQYVQAASPVTTGSCVLGIHRFGEDTLFIPSEVVVDALEPLGITSNKTTNPTFDQDLSGWTYDPTYVSWEQTYDDPSGDHDDGWLRADVDGVSTIISQQITDQIEPDRIYTITAHQFQADGYEGVLTVKPDIWAVMWSDSTYASIPTWDGIAGDTLSVFAAWDGTQAGDFHYIFDSIDGTATRVYLVRDSSGFISFPTGLMKVWADGVEITAGTYTVPSNQEVFYEVEFLAPVKVAQIGERHNVVGDGWNGTIRSLNMVTSGDERFYPMILDQPTQPTTTNLEDTLNNQDGTITGPVWERIGEESVTMTGDDTGRIDVIGSSSFVIEITANVNTETSAVFFYDQIEVYDAEVGRDQDELINEFSDNIAIRGSIATTYGANYENGILAEFENQIYRFQVDTSTADIIDPITGTGIEDFNVDTELGIEEFYVEERDVDLPSNNRGICLEISQIKYDETV